MFVVNVLETKGRNIHVHTLSSESGSRRWAQAKEMRRLSGPRRTVPTGLKQLLHSVQNSTLLALQAAFCVQSKAESQRFTELATSCDLLPTAVCHGQ